MAVSQRWVVTASGDRRLDEVEKELADAGFEVDQVLREIGSIIGSASSGVAKKARAIRGVADVSPDHPIDIGPPDADVIW